MHFSKLLNRLAVLNSEIGLFAGDGVGAGVGDGDGVNDGEVVVGLAITTPLFQSNFFPDLIQVNVFPDATEIFPALGQVAPALTAANEGIIGNADTRDKQINVPMVFLMGATSYIPYKPLKLSLIARPKLHSKLSHIPF